MKTKWLSNESDELTVVARFLVHANGICAGYSFLSAVVAAVPRPSTMSKAWTVFFLDQVDFNFFHNTIN